MHAALRRAAARDLRERCAIGDPLEPATLVGPLIDGARSMRMQAALAAARDAGRHGALRRARRRRRAPAYYVRPAIVEMPAQRRPDAATRPSRRSSTSSPYDTLDEAIALNNAVRARARRRRSSRATCARPSCSCRRAAPTAASPTSTSAPAAPRSAARSAARRRPAAAASRAPTPGRPTCAARPTRSTTASGCRWRRASVSTSDAPGARGGDCAQS